MPPVAHTLVVDQPLYGKAEPERNQHRQIALSLRALFRNREWLQAHVLKDMC